MVQRRTVPLALATALAASTLLPVAGTAATDTLTVDLGASTGAFHGGAGGTLYGVYGPGVPSDAVLAGFYPKTLSTKAQDGPQHPGADALEVAEPFVANGGRDVYVYMTDIYRGFPYQRQPGQAGRDDYRAKVEAQVRQVLASEHRDHIVYVPVNEPEGNFYGTGQYSYNKVSWLTDPRPFFEEWEQLHDLIKSLDPQARIGGPNTSLLYDQVKGFLEYCKANDCLPDVITWHELSSPDKVRTSVAKYRSWEAELGIGPLPININEYAFRYHLSVPGQMIQWVSALEESKVDGDLAYWNIDGNLNDSVAEANKANGQWWLFNAYGQMSGDTVRVTPPLPGKQYTLQGVATLDRGKRQARTIFGGANGAADVRFTNVDRDVFGDRVHVTVQEIPWTGQLGDSPAPRRLLDTVQSVGTDGSLVLPFTDLEEMSAYQVIVSPAGGGTAAGANTQWRKTYEAEDAAHTGTGWSRNGPEGSPANVSKFATSNFYNVGGLRTGSDVVLSFAVDVPQTGTYDLSVLSSTYNKYASVVPQGPTNVFLRVDGEQPQELRLPTSYGWVVWEHTDTRVQLTAGKHTITLAASDPQLGSTKGDAIIDKIDLALVDPTADGHSSYEAEYADLRSAAPRYNVVRSSGPGVAAVPRGGSATFWVHADHDGHASVSFDHFGGGKASVRLNGRTVDGLTVGGARGSDTTRLFLSAGINQLTVTGTSDTLRLDRVRTSPSTAAVPVKVEAESGEVTGAATFTGEHSFASGQVATNVGDGPANALSLQVTAERAGQHVLVIRYANAQESIPTHYNPDPVTRHADISVNGRVQRVQFPNTFHFNQFRDLAVPVDLVSGTNTITFTSQELPNWDGTTHNEYGQRSKYAPNIDYVTVAPLVG
ncbi:carbohydrate-binding protein [Saccharothrix deserti]|uniref:carbohydrate-binding protein n=1 Tax=Saccharothrix deserti TaxID=2593674 RepID=UPI00131C92C0|nr:carbohydrate-binding protein [Saccharothrix deserti]